MKRLMGCRRDLKRYGDRPGGQPLAPQRADALDYRRRGWTTKPVRPPVRIRT
jgi:hypothetical protein